MDTAKGLILTRGDAMATQQMFIQDLDSFSAESCVLLSRVATSAPIVVGLDGTDTGRGAAAMALRLARAWDAPLRVVSALEPDRDVLEKAVEWRRHAARERARREALTSFAESADAEGISCDIDIDDGCAITRLIDCAISSSAGLIVLGLRASTERAPVFYDDTALRLIRRITIPLLAVTPDVSEQPRRAIAAIDFSPASAAAARAALKVLQPGGTLLLAHLPPDFSTAESRADGIASSYSQATAFAFERFTRELGAPRSMSIATVQLDGTLIEGLAKLADDADADLIAIGTGRRDLTTFNGAPHPVTAFLRQRRRTILAVPAPKRRIERLIVGA
jgi:nucleotide-binding universal stress UspA family protein